MDFNKIQGFDKLSEGAKAMFIRVDARHRNTTEDKEGWTVIKVKERKDHIEVHFKNGIWLHYLPNGSWY